MKAQLAADLTSEKKADGSTQTVKPYVDQTKKIFACKIYDTENFAKEDLEMVFKEVKINSMLRSEYCIRHYQTIKTSNKIYMIQEYANCFDLDCLLEQRGTLKQDEARIIMRQLAKGIKDLQSMKIVHRDMKLANVLLHFPDRPKLDKLPPNMKRQFLKTVNLTQIPFEVKISDFGLSTVFEGNQS